MKKQQDIPSSKSDTLLCVKTREILSDQGRSLWYSVLAFGERTLRKDEKMDENLILYSGFMSLLVLEYIVAALLCIIIHNIYSCPQSEFSPQISMLSSSC